MYYKKGLVAFAVAGACVSGTAYATDLDDPNAVPSTIAIELDIPSPAGLTILDGGLNNLDVGGTSTVGVGASEGDQRFVRYELDDGMVWGAGGLGGATMGGAASASPVSGGGATDNFAIYSFTAPVGGIAQGDPVTLDINSVVATTNAPVTLSYAVYETLTLATAAVDGTDLVNKTAPFVAFAPGLSIDTESVTPVLIDVATNSTLFVGSALPPAPTTPNNVGRVVVDVTTGVANAAGAQITLGELVAAGTAIAVSGPFAAAQDVDADGPTGDFTEPNENVFAVPFPTTCSSANPPPSGVLADTLDGTVATFVDPNANTPLDWNICYRANGQSELETGDVTANYDVVAATNTNTADVPFGLLSVLAKNGSTEFLQLSLTPSSEGGVFRNFIRICNNSSIDGRVFILAQNDLGDSAAFDLAAVAGFSSNVLDAENCTAQITIDDIYAAAQATDSTFAVGDPENKLRLTIEGEFQNITVDNLSVSRDNQSFFPFN